MKSCLGERDPGPLSLIWPLVWLVIQFDVWQCLSSETVRAQLDVFLFSAAARLLNYSDETTAETVD